MDNSENNSIPQNIDKRVLSQNRNRKMKQKPHQNHANTYPLINTK